MRVNVKAVATLAVVGYLAAMVSPAAAAETFVVTPVNMQGWVVDNVGSPLTVTTSFVSGPAVPHLGTGSIRLSVGSNGDGAAQLRHAGFAGTRLDQLTELRYSTYVEQPGSGGEAPYIILSLDLDGDGVGDDFLVFEPVYQDATFFPDPQASLELGMWQRWDALLGGWWSVKGIGGATSGVGVKTISEYLLAAPHATIVNSASGLDGAQPAGGFRVGAGDSFVGNVDAVTVGVLNDYVAYDFELYSMPRTKGDCRKGGWREFNPPTGLFSGPGECVKSLRR